MFSYFRVISELVKMSRVQYKQEEQQKGPGSGPSAWAGWLLMRPHYAHWLDTPGQLTNHISLPGRVGDHDRAVLRARTIIHVKLCCVIIRTITFMIFMIWNFPTAVV